ncbi:MAG: hypothetical protein EOO06_16170 [Chitinophagaceae bacterium]|nr:MAG: hypothetical protein EOO06_16170 [Chitinophagaceae bacterium]
MLLKTALIVLLSCASATFTGYLLWSKPAGKVQRSSKVSSTSLRRGQSSKTREDKLKSVSVNIRSFAERKNYNGKIAFLIDMSLPSGENRFFVYNLIADTVEHAGLVTHGYGSVSGEIEFSNVPGSYCTSLGRYKVGKEYSGRFGMAFKLHGLDKTNDKAFERFVVLHSHSCVPDKAIAPLNICESQGCPTVAPAFLSKLKKYIDASDKPILLSIYR